MSFVSAFAFKSDAEKTADRLRAEGRNARVVLGSRAGPGNTIGRPWRVYAGRIYTGSPAYLKKMRR
jgi:hypothetical protein